MQTQLIALLVASNVTTTKCMRWCLGCARARERSLRSARIPSLCPTTGSSARSIFKSLRRTIYGSSSSLLTSIALAELGRESTELFESMHGRHLMRGCSRPASFRDGGGRSSGGRSCGEILTERLRGSWAATVNHRALPNYRRPRGSPRECPGRHPS